MDLVIDLMMDLMMELGRSCLEAGSQLRESGNPVLPVQSTNISFGITMLGMDFFRVVLLSSRCLKSNGELLSV